MVERPTSELGPVQIPVNNAEACPFFEITEELWGPGARDLKGAFLCSRAVARVLVERRLRGRIVSISSISSWVGGSRQVHYTPTKAAFRH
jgi:L-rhamnose 1-dehydrogenase